MSWTKVGYDNGREGLEWKWKLTANALTIFINGSDHAKDWGHHSKIRLIEAAHGVWVTEADLELAKDIIQFVRESETEVVRIGGHSWGGAIAALVVWMLNRPNEVNVRGYLYGPKQAGNELFITQVSPFITSYRHRGDIVPLLMFWLARFQMKKIGSWMWPWKAHGPDTYHTQMAADGFR